MRLVFTTARVVAFRAFNDASRKPEFTPRVGEGPFGVYPGRARGKRKV